MPQRIAMISDHASPLAAVGGIDSGGQNIYVAETARHLAARGYLVDVFTRKDQPDQPEVVEWLPGVRVIHVPAGPAAFVRKEDILPLDAGVRGVRAAIRRRASATTSCTRISSCRVLVAMQLKSVARDCRSS